MGEDRREFIRRAGLAGLGLSAARPARAAQVRRGLALCIGINRLDPYRYAGWSGALAGSEFDVETIGGIAAAAGFDVRALRSVQATRDAVRGGILEAAAALRTGDMFLFHYSGHGGQLPDRNGDEGDGLDESYCLHDCLMIDDEMYGLWAEFRPGVRVLALIDCCHGGTVAAQAATVAAAAIPAPTPDGMGRQVRRVASQDPTGFRSMPPARPPTMSRSPLPVPNKSLPRAQAGPAAMRYAFADEPNPDGTRYRLMPGLTRARRVDAPGQPEEWVDLPRLILESNRSFYDGVLEEAHRAYAHPIRASVLILAGCEDYQRATDTPFGGQYTLRLGSIWEEGRFRGTYADFHQAIRRVMPAWQTPFYYRLGAADPAFEAQRPFTI